MISTGSTSPCDRAAVTMVFHARMPFTMSGPGLEIGAARKDPLNTATKRSKYKALRPRRRIRFGNVPAPSAGESKFEENLRIYFESGAEALCMFYRDRTLAL
jgi:hypothetical protein